mmetsp:Transcript_31631/g.37217  ORF Transcript_31631/g.37217 Transcript_31631/m.37217 type:complete len:366 (-) Transcript_31631:708-1805(-)
MDSENLTTAWFKSPPDCCPKLYYPTFIHPLTTVILNGEEQTTSHSNFRLKISIVSQMASNSKQHIMIFIDSIDHDSAFSRRLNLNSIDIFGGDDNNDGVLAFRDSEGRKNNDILLVLKSPSSYFLQVLIKCVNKTTGAELLKLGSEEYDQQTYLSINFPMYRKLVSIKTPKTKRRRLSDISTPMPMTDYSCQVCLGVPCGEVYECSNEHIFCAECLKEHMKQSAAFSQYCPLCRVTLPSSDQPTRRPLIEEIIANSPAKCLHCPTSLITKDLPHHGMVCRGVYNKLKKMEYKQPNDPIPKQLHVGHTPPSSYCCSRSHDNTCFLSGDRPDEVSISRLVDRRAQGYYHGTHHFIQRSCVYRCVLKV